MRKRVALGGAVAVMTVGALLVVQNSFAATIPGLGASRQSAHTGSAAGQRATAIGQATGAATGARGGTTAGAQGGTTAGQQAAGNARAAGSGLRFPRLGATTRVASSGDKAGNCPDAHIIVTRASTEAPGTGIIGSLATAVTRASDQTITVEATDYPALLNPYPPSVAAGTKALTTQLTNEATNCPDTKIVVMGYSQGAHVIGDVLAGTGRVAGFTQSAAISTGVSDKVVAVILMGDPRYVPGKSFNAGTSQTRGLFARGEDASLDAFTGRTQSYCDTGDTFCASGASVAVHLSYTRKYNNVAEKFVLSKIGG
ncbi:cutinase family protein [Actinoplanes sp. HUAS TT8]|uniref:cutinase family protein n=1 Tax=Actinoplanes sp. HUAS TT8 TaxID=3447453 RepID=UPI003F51DC56